MLSEDSKYQKEAWLSGTRDAVWSSNGGELLIVPYKSTEIWALELSRWSLSGSYSSVRICHLFLI